jgi:phenylacetate-coenzyme A ligase PaaK-like adenylate-forming protein
MGGAYQCESGNYHFDICSYLEIVDFENLAPVKVGEEGTLLLTTLHPFQQATPLIRYSTGDLVIRGPDECGCGEAGASFSKVLGRSKYCIYLGRPSKSDSNRKWIGHYEVRDILEKYPEYFIIEGYEAPIIKMMKEEREDSIKIKIEVCINKGVEKAEAEKKAKEGINEILAPWKDQLETGRLEVMINSLEVPAYTDPRSIRFFEQH